MTDELYTIADATSAGEDLEQPRERAILVVYYDQGTESRTRLLELAEGGEVTFGRTRTATVYIDSEKVSRMHARLVRRDGEIRVEDLGSRNGTRVNGVRIAEPTRLSSGDEIGVGPTSAVVSITTRAERRIPVRSSSQLEDRLEAEVDRGRAYQRRFALIMFRLDGDAEATDAALGRISGHLRRMDVLAEYGPDEFGVLCPELAGSQAEETAGRIARAALAGITAGPVELRVGLALFPDHGSQPGELLSRARSALRVARAGAGAEVAVPPEEPKPADGLVIKDPQTRRVFSLARKVASHPITVLITGETGVGKEVIAEEIHRNSDRSSGPLVKLNCASIPDTLLESELFGHERGAFTGADRQKQGYFEAADGGTLFLDEIGEVSASIQAKLLRVLEERTFTRVGGTKEITVDVRVVCATNRDLEAEVRDGRFREDLFFRVSAFTIVLPPLRDRLGEVPLLAEHFLRQAAEGLRLETPALSVAASSVLTRYDWPGNVRELRNAMERAVVLCTGGVIEPEDLPERIRRDGRPAPPAAGATGRVDDHIAEVERAALVAALEACAGNQTRAAKRLGVSRRALIYRMEKYGLKPAPGKSRR